VSTDTWVE